MDTKIDKRKGSELGLGADFADVPAFQIVQDAGSKVRAISGAIVTIEHGPLAASAAQHPSWSGMVAASIDFHQRFDALGQDAALAAQLIDETRAFWTGKLTPLQEFLAKARAA
jgi:hypothetical protein